MTQLEAPPVTAEVIDGVVSTFDRVYTFDRFREIHREGAGRVRRARVHLFGLGESRLGVAEATLILEDGSAISESGEGATMRESIDLLAARLLRRLRGIDTD